MLRHCCPTTSFPRGLTRCGGASCCCLSRTILPLVRVQEAHQVLQLPLRLLKYTARQRWPGFGLPVGEIGTFLHSSLAWPTYPNIMSHPVRNPDSEEEFAEACRDAHTVSDLLARSGLARIFTHAQTDAPSCNRLLYTFGQPGASPASTWMQCWRPLQQTTAAPPSSE